MQYRPLGRTGVHVSPLCLGAMMFGPWGNEDEADSVRIIHRALDAGINFVDTADVYSGGVSEEIVGKAIEARREDVFLATKFFMPLYQVHRPSPDTDVSETLGALSDLVHQGKVRYIGSSSYSGSRIVEAQSAARERHLERFVTEQPPYSILVRGVEEDVLPTARRHGMGTLTYSPLAGGWLSGRYRKNASGGPASAARPQARFDMDVPANQRKLDAAEQLAVLAEKAGLTLIELAVAFVINHPGVTSAIIGPRTMEQLEAFLPAAAVTLPADVLDAVDEIVGPRSHGQPGRQQLRRLRAATGPAASLTSRVSASAATP
ncbi:aldo/keto reductase [Streptomyces sp. NPDC058193]|uniref:aldo/keto reductase n=1 Tax=Streptomyces sp. NPDC058193 TaxID=3346373 RepID=UPI0036EA36EA